MKKQKNNASTNDKKTKKTDHSDS